MTATLTFTLPEEQQETALTGACGCGTVQTWEPAAHVGLQIDKQV